MTRSIFPALALLALSVHAPAGDKPAEAIPQLQRKLHGEWKGSGPCGGRLTLRADGTYERRHFSPGDNKISGTWTVRWDALPPTLVLACKESDDPDLASKRTEVKLIQLDAEALVYQYPGAPPAHFNRVKE